MPTNRVTVVIQEPLFGDDPFDGFVQRQRVLMEWLHEVHETTYVALRRREVGARPLRPEIASRLAEVVEYQPLYGTRSARLARAGAAFFGRLRDIQPWEDQLVAAVRRTQPASVLTIGPWADAEFRTLRQGFETTFLFEEHLWRMRELAPQSVQGRLLRAVEYAAQRRLPQPKTVFVIAPTERRFAQWRFAGAKVEWLPFVLDETEWPQAPAPTDGDGVLAIGVFSQDRNAEGLRDVLGASPELRIKVASDAGLHPMLTPYVSKQIRRVTGANPYDLYRQAACALVPSRRATGVKTTILQAWRAGCPVVCFTPLAKPLGPIPKDAVAHASTPERVGKLCIEIAGNPELRLRMADAGFRALETLYNPVTVRGQFLRQIDGDNSRLPRSSLRGESKEPYGHQHGTT